MTKNFKSLIIKLAVTLSVTTIATLSSVTSYAQINFEKGSFSETLKKASDEGKMIFMDCFTDWCMPCKILDHFVFKSVEGGEYFNAKFINFKIDMEKGEGIELQKKYNVTSFPTLLLINPDGSEHNRLTGATNNPKEFIARVEEASKKENSPEYQRKLYESDKSRANLYFAFLLSRGEYNTVSELMLETFKVRTVEENFSKESFELYDKAVHDIFNPLFSEILEDIDEAKRLLGNDKVTEFVNSKSASAFSSLAGAIMTGKITTESEPMKKLSALIAKFPVLSSNSMKFLYAAEKQLVAQSMPELSAIALEYIKSGVKFDENTIPGVISMLVYFNKDYKNAITFYENLAAFTKDEANRTKFLKNVEAYKKAVEKQSANSVAKEATTPK
ncbi:MAG: thioredoxin family protein [Bacteroidales bacterium]